MSVKHRLVMTLASAGVPVDTVTISGNSAAVTYMQWATQEQRDQGEAILAAFDWSSEAQQAWEDARDPHRSDLRNRAAAAVADLDAFLALVNPTAAQVRTATQKLAQITRALILRVVEV